MYSKCSRKLGTYIKSINLNNFSKEKIIFGPFFVALKCYKTRTLKKLHEKVSILKPNLSFNKTGSINKVRNVKSYATHAIVLIFFFFL